MYVRALDWESGRASGADRKVSLVKMTKGGLGGDEGVSPKLSWVLGERSACGRTTVSLVRCGSS